jgi:hypothetical protein
MLEGVSRACSRISCNAMIYEGTCAGFHAMQRPTKALATRCGRLAGTRCAFFVSGISIKIDLTDTHTYLTDHALFFIISVFIFLMLAFKVTSFLVSNFVGRVSSVRLS